MFSLIQSAVLTDIQSLSFFFSIVNLPCPNLNVTLYCHISKLYLETWSIMRGASSTELLPSAIAEANTDVSRVL